MDLNKEANRQRVNAVPIFKCIQEHGHAFLDNNCTAARVKISAYEMYEIDIDRFGTLQTLTII